MNNIIKNIITEIEYLLDEIAQKKADKFESEVDKALKKISDDYEITELNEDKRYVDCRISIPQS